MKKIILTGGGSAGHVTPNLALIPELKRRGFEVLYVCSKDGMEREILEKEGVPYKTVTADKLRRYLSVKTLTAPIRIQHGYHEAIRLLRREKPDVIFAKGGYVSVPVVKAAKRLKIPTLLHESDLTPGLANKLCFQDVTFALCNFPETLDYLPAGKSFVSGCPIRESLKEGSREAGLAFTGLPGQKPVLLIIGGSLGSVYLNNKVRNNLNQLLERFEIVHLCRKGHLDESLSDRPGYVQYEYISEQMKDLFAMADLVLSRSGANAICELLYLKKPMLLVPLSKAASRGDQILNARSFEKQGFAVVMEEEEITDEKLLAAIYDLYDRREEFRTKMAESLQSDAVSFVCDKIGEAMKHA
ncbi:MAG: undecaprenyldiphospho-muramoylpentapeptide beta-N-acetylglucosaminyltransferase [Lachnospiraceae bacterium]|nr:undecaprenyldiphospho-muramoylpentapeptide beta-N-acetylglucosaminyltransferase [Lachnospiraceae bacterium]